MPLPLPTLDTRRWSDLAAEGRALIPRYAPAWTDHNIHDPGIMLMELFAWLSEQLIYRSNRVPERHLRKFLALAGFPPRPPGPAAVVLGAGIPLGVGPVVLPAGVVCQADAASPAALGFRVVRDTPLVEAALATVQGFDGARFTDLTRIWRDGSSLQPLGVDPRPPFAASAGRAPALYLGFDGPIAAGQELSLGFGVDGSGWDVRVRLAAEAADRREDCPPARPCPPCAPPPDSWCGDPEDSESAPTAPPPAPVTTAPHHSVRTVWECLTAAGWQAVEGRDLTDETRGLSIDGMVRLTMPAALVAQPVGVVAEPRSYLRCRLSSGRFDATPAFRSIVANAVEAEQRSPAWQRFTIVAGGSVTGAVTAGAWQRLTLGFDSTGRLQLVTVEPASAAVPETLVLEFTAPTATTTGMLTLALAHLDVGLGFPEQQVVITDAPIARDSLALRSLEPIGGGTLTRTWRWRDDLDASRPIDADVAVDAASGTLTFGTGVRGRLVPEGAPIVAEYEATRGAAGNVAPARSWSLPAEPINQALLGTGSPLFAGMTLSNVEGGARGTDAETVGDAMERAAAFLWSHERLVELAQGARRETLDQLSRDRVLALDAPMRATTVLDYERIALDVPGTRVARARAFADFDPRVPCYDAPGTVTVVIVPYLPADRPAPSQGLLAEIKRYLERRRLLTTRLLVVGPSYVDVRVEAVVRATDSASPARVRTDIQIALDSFLHPLRGGPDGLGWPFGRDVYRGEILAVIDQVPGVDHVLSASIWEVRDGVEREVQCGNVCVPPTFLVAPLPHAIEVESV